MKSKHYLILGAVFFSMVLASALLPHGGHKKYPSTQAIQYLDNKALEQKLTADTKNISPAIITLSFLLALYGLLFFAGIGNLAYFTIRKLAGKPLLDSDQTPAALATSREKLARIFCALGAFVLIIQLSGQYIAITGKEENSILQGLILNFFMELGVIAIIFKGMERNDLGLSNHPRYLAAIQVYTAILPLVVIAAMLSEWLGFKMQSTSAIDLLFHLKDRFTVNLLLIQAVIFGPIAEELLFRGFLFKALRDKYSFLISASVISLIFASLHAEPTYTLPLFAVSMGLCYVYERTQSICSVIIFHALFNTINVALILTLKDILI